MSADKNNEYKTKEQRDAAALREKQERQHAIRIKELRALLQDRAFRRHTWRQINLCGFYTYGFEPSANVHFRDGRQSIAGELLTDLNEADPMIEGVMRKECLEDEANGYGA